MRNSAFIGFGMGALITLAAPVYSQRGGRGGPNPAAIAAVKARYRKIEALIPMRDGAKLFRSIYVPRDSSRSYPFLMSRTPRSANVCAEHLRGEAGGFREGNDARAS